MSSPPPHLPRTARHAGAAWLCWLSLGLATAAASDSARRVATLTGALPGGWDAGQHLWVKGEVGVSPAALDRLERWLDAEAPNWTVAVLADAAGETFRAAGGRNYSGMDAVEHALGEGLPNQTGFGELRDPRTGEKNGAALAIFLRERKFSYSGGEAFDRRGLGEDDWVGHLDRPAFRAMSNGGRVVDAVTGTIDEIEGQLTRQIAQEIRRRQDEALRAERMRAQAAEAVARAAAEADSIEAAAQAFRAANGSAVGDLANPRAAAWRARADAAAELLRAGRTAEAAAAATEVAEFRRAYEAMLARHPQAGPRFADLNRAIAELDPEGGGWGAAQLEEARGALAEAQVAHERGESGYEVHLRAAEAAYASAKEEIERAHAAARRRLEAQRALAVREARRERAMRGLGIGGAGALGAGALGVGFAANRRRRPFKLYAAEALERLQRRFRDSRDRLFALLDRANAVVGSELELDKRGYCGETLELSRDVIAEVDRLFVMSASVERVIGEARGEAVPAGPLGRLHNFFGTARYRRAVALLKDLPIQFQPGDGVAPLAREDGDDVRLLGRVEAQEGFALTFEELVAQFETLAASAQGKLDTIEQAWAEIDRALDRAQDQIDSAAASASRLADRSEEDGMFPVEALRTKLLPAAQEHLDAAIAIGNCDPVGALDDIAEADRRSAEAAELLAIIDTTRDERLPRLGDSCAALAGAGRATAWVDRWLRAAGIQIEALAAEAVAERKGQAIGEFEAGFERICGVADEAVELAGRAVEKTKAGIEAGAAAVARARETLGAALGLPPGELLREPGLVPDEALDAAEQQRGAALAAIDRGGVWAAREALEEAERLTGEANGLVEVSLRAHAEHDETVGRRRSERAALLREQPEIAALLGAMRDRYAATALREGGGAQGRDIGDLLRGGEDGIDAAEQLVERAAEELGRGAVIESAGLLADAGDVHEDTRLAFDAVRDHDAELRRLESANATRLAQLESVREGLAADCGDHRTRRSTQAEFAGADSELGAVRGADADDPFARAGKLSDVAAQFDKVAALVANDRDLFDEAKRSVGIAMAHVAAAQRLGHQAAADKIPDSRRTLELQEEVEKLALAAHSIDRNAREPHEDWAAMDAEADRLAQGAARAAAELRGELERAQTAVAAISSAATAVREAAGWSGAFGVRVAGSPGSEILMRARDHLLSGRYIETGRLAADAGRAARHAIAEARAEVARARRREEERRAAERREAERRRRRRSSSSFGSSFGGGRSSSSSISSRSSFRSGSGMSRSGW